MTAKFLCGSRGSAIGLHSPVVIDDSFRQLVEELLSEHVPNWRSDPEEKIYYQSLFSHWL
jgi:hypothetical protein